MSYSTYMQDREYMLHRKRMLSTQSSISRILRHPSPEQLISHRGHRALLEERRISQANEALHRRLVRVQAGESVIHGEQVRFEERFLEDKDKLARNRLLSRAAQQGELQAANERIYHRLQSTHAQFSVQDCRRWYDGHVRRRPDKPSLRDQRVPRELKPARLPRLAGADASEASGGGGGSLHSRPRSVVSSPSGVRRLYRGGDFSSSGAGSSLASFASSTAGNSWLDEDKAYTSLGPLQLLLAASHARSAPRRRVHRHRKSLRPLAAEAGDEGEARGEGLPLPDEEEPSGAPLALPSPSKSKSYKAASSSSNRRQSLADLAYMQEDEEGGDALCIAGRPAALFRRIISWEFAIPSDSRNCIVRVWLPRDAPDEHVYLDVVTETPPHRKLSEKRLDIDELFDIFESNRSLHQMADEDASSLRNLLRSIFIEADEDGSGQLDFSELQTMLDKMNLGLSSSDLRSVAAEADVDESGYVDYEEYIPLAVDMILGFRARARANVHQIDVALAAALQRSISTDEIDAISELCVAQFMAADPHGTGAISMNLFKSRLGRAASIGLLPSDVRMLVANMPRDYKGRCLYTNFREVLYEARYIAANNAIIEAQGSDLQKHIVELCLGEERRLASELPPRSEYEDEPVLNGTIPLRSLVDILLSSPRLALNRLQVMLLTSEANVVKGKINIYQFVPACIKTIEMMFDPTALRMRAELLSNEDWCVDKLLEGGEPQASFETRVAKMFRAADTDNSGGLDLDEFRRVLADLNVGISEGEATALYTLADTGGSGQVDLAEFSAFVSKILVDLLRERKILALVETSQRRERGSVRMRQEQHEELVRGLLAAKMGESAGAAAVGGALVEAALREHPTCGRRVLEVLLSEVCPVPGAEEPVGPLLGLLGGVLEAFAGRHQADTAGEFETSEERAGLSRLLKHPLLVLNSGVLFDDLSARLQAIDQRHSDSLARQQAYYAALLDAHVRRTEANHMFRRMFPATNTTPAIAQGTATPAGAAAPSVSALVELWREAYRLTLLRGLAETPWTSALFEQLHRRLEQEAKKTPLADADEFLLGHRGALSLRSALSLLTSDRVLRLSRREALHALFLFDGHEVSRRITKFKHLAKVAADSAVLFRSRDHLLTAPRLLDSLVSLAPGYMAGLTRAALLDYLAGALSAEEHATHVSEVALIKVLPAVPLIQLGERELFILLALLPIQEDGTILRSDLEARLFADLCQVRWARLFARRYAMLPPSSEAAEASYLLAMQRFSERLLNSAKLENRSGHVCITFPDAHGRLLRAGSQDEGAEDAGHVAQSASDDSALAVKTFQCMLPVVGSAGDTAHPGVSAKVTASIRSSVAKSMSGGPAALHVAAVLAGAAESSAPLRLVHTGVPSLATVDEEAAEEFMLTTVRSLVLAVVTTHDHDHSSIDISTRDSAAPRSNTTIPPGVTYALQINM